MRHPARALAVMLAIGVAACATRTEHFAPTERPTAVSPEGYVAAQYDALVAGEAQGDVRVWTSGAFYDESDERTLVHVGFELENNGYEPLELLAREVSIESATADGVVPEPAALVHQAGRTRVEPGEQSSVELYFAMPRGIKPQHLDAFQVRWAVVTPSGRYAQRTPFTEYETGYGRADFSYYYYSPFYDPFLYGPPIHPVRIVHPVPYHHGPRVLRPVRHHR